MLICPCAVLLSSRDIRGVAQRRKHCERDLTRINDYDIADKIRYLMADNATANDRAVRVLNASLNIDPERDRLRCGAHVIDLVAKTVPYGTDNDAIDLDEHEDCLSDSRHISACEAVVQSEHLEKALQTWRRNGPVRKLHNLVTHKLLRRHQSAGDSLRRSKTLRPIPTTAGSIE